MYHSKVQNTIHSRHGQGLSKMPTLSGIVGISLCVIYWPVARPIDLKKSDHVLLGTM